MNNNKSSGSANFIGLLTIVFITLKLCAVINWSWLWVLAPLWIPVAIFILLVLFFIVQGIWEKK